VRKVDNLTTILCRCHEIWEPNFLEPSGPLQACMGLLYLYLTNRNIWLWVVLLAAPLHVCICN